jgi:hypothetical protein
MFGILGSLTKAAVGVVTLPLDVVADVVTLGGAMTDRPVPYTAEKVSGIMENIADAVNPDDYNRKG